MHSAWVYILLMAAVTYAVRVLPLTLIKKPVTNRFVRSFLYYVPYVTLAVMTFPAIINAVSVPAAGIAALVIGIAMTMHGTGLFQTAAVCCLTVFLIEYFF